MNKKMKQVSRQKVRPNLPFRRVISRFLHPYFDEFLNGIVWELIPLDQTQPLNTLTLVPSVRNLKEFSLVKYHIENLGIQERCFSEVKHLIRFAVKTFRIRNVLTIAEAKKEAEAQLISWFEKEKTPNGLSTTFFRALRDQTALTNAILHIALSPLPMKTVKSQGIPV